MAILKGSIEASSRPEALPLILFDNYAIFVVEVGCTRESSRLSLKQWLRLVSMFVVPLAICLVVILLEISTIGVVRHVWASTVVYVTDIASRR